MSTLQFIPSSATGLFLPFHCGKPLRFGIITCRCAGGCNEAFDTLDATAETERRNRRPVDLQSLAAQILVYGLFHGFPLEAPRTKEESPARENPAAEFAAQSIALDAIAKARGK